MSGNLSQADKDEPNVVILSMKAYEPNLARKAATVFFSNFVPEQILKEISDILAERSIAFKISDKTWKITYTLQLK